MDIAQIAMMIVHFMGPIVLALIIVLLGRFLSLRLARAVERLLANAPNADPTLARFISSLVQYSTLFFVILIALAVAGIDIAAFEGVILGLGAAAAFILKDSLADLAAGIMLVLFRPFSIGHEIDIQGHKGVVTAIGLLATRLITRDNVEMIIANGAAWGGIIRNHSVLGARRLDIIFNISYEADIDEAIAAITRTAGNNPRVHKSPQPWAKVVNLGESSVDIELRAWCDFDDLRKLRMEISQPIKQAFNQAGIEIPYEREVKVRKNVTRSKARDRIARLQTLKNSA